MQKSQRVIHRLAVGIGIIAAVVRAYHRKPCNRSARRQFQFPDCYAPGLSQDILLTQATFVMAHDTATGYIVPNQKTSSGISWFYSKNQVQSVYHQLNNGARALDLRPRLWANQSVSFHHSVTIHVLLEDLLADAIRWSNENPHELVLLFHSHFSYEDSSVESDMVSALSKVYKQYGVAYISCDDAYELTVGGAMELGALSGGGAIVAMDRQDGTGYFCGKDNWVESRIVTCYPRPNVTCTRSKLPQSRLDAYLLESANNEATDDSSTLGPPASGVFWQIQAFWQVTASSTALGLAHFSNILLDVTKSGVNQHTAELIHGDKFQNLNLVAVDHLAVHGNAIFSVLRNTCGQTDIDECGSALALPKFSYTHIGVAGWILIVLVSGYLLSLFVAICFFRQRPRWILTLMSRLEEVLKWKKEEPILPADQRSKGLLT